MRLALLKVQIPCKTNSPRCNKVLRLAKAMKGNAILDNEILEDMPGDLGVQRTQGVVHQLHIEQAVGRPGQTTG